MKPKYLGLFLAIFLFIGLDVYAEERPQVEFFSPHGTVKTVRQVTARFSEQMVPSGDHEVLSNPLKLLALKKEPAAGRIGRIGSSILTKSFERGFGVSSNRPVNDALGKGGGSNSMDPEVGKYSLALADGDEKILDYVYFEVGGPEADRNLMSEDGEGTFTN